MCNNVKSDLHSAIYNGYFLWYTVHVMTGKDLADYIAELINRHPGLSFRQAALQAQLNVNAVTQIINREILKPTPHTLHKLANQWGNQADYYEMMLLAGYDVPLPPGIDDPQEAETLTLFRSLTTEARDGALKILRALAED